MKMQKLCASNYAVFPVIRVNVPDLGSWRNRLPSGKKEMNVTSQHFWTWIPPKEIQNRLRQCWEYHLNILVNIGHIKYIPYL